MIHCNEKWGKWFSLVSHLAFHTKMLAFRLGVGRRLGCSLSLNSPSSPGLSFVRRPSFSRAGGGAPQKPAKAQRLSATQPRLKRRLWEGLL